MRGIRGAFIAGAVGLATLLGWAGPASAATGTQRFTIVAQFGPGQESCTIVAIGPITGVGTCVVENGGEKVTTVHSTIDGSSFDTIFTTQSETENFNERACVSRFTQNETFVLEGVSGAFANASGSGTDVVSGTFVAPRTASGCAEDEGSGFVVARVTGTVTV